MILRRLFALILSLAIFVGICLVFTSCGVTPPAECTEQKDNDGDGICDTEGCGEAVEPAPTPDAGLYNENGELILFKDGAPTFSFVYGTDARSSVSAPIKSLATQLEGLCVGEIGSYADNDKNYTPKEVEIIFGTVKNRGDEYYIDRHTLGLTGYMVKQVGTKIIVQGGSDEALTTAFEHLKTEVFGIKKQNPPFTNFAMAASANYENIITDYNLKDIKLLGESIREFTLISQSSDKPARTIAEYIQSSLYEKAGIWLESKGGTSVSDDTKSILIRTVENDGESDGFVIRGEGDDVIIECMYPKLFEENFKEIFDKLLKKKGTATLDAKSIHLRTIYYEDYADKTGKKSAIEGIIECHNYANENGHSVKALRSGEGTFYIGKTDGKHAIILTSTDWTGATFIIDDSILTTSDTDFTKHIFYVKSENAAITYKPDEAATSGIEKFLADINAAGGLRKEEFNSALSFDLGLKRDALVYICNANHRNYVRYGPNNDEGQEQKEFIYLKADGTVDEKTGLLYDYDEITSIEVVYVDDTPVTITGGTIKTIANQFPRLYDYYTRRGIEITRSNTTIDGLTHLIEGEGEDGAPYSGFITISKTNNVVVKNSVLTGHKAYGLLGNESSNVMGTYDLSPGSCNKTTFLNVTQTNFLISVNGKDVPSVGNGYWGIMGGNDCKNLTYDGCRLTRFDSHRGTLNATIIRSDVAAIQLIGGGDLIIEDSRVYMQTSSHSNLLLLRDDYGATWNGELTIKNVEMVMHPDFSGSYVSIISGTWRTSEYASHDFGYDCYMPRVVTVDNLTVSADSVTTVLLASGSITSVDNSVTINSYYTTEQLYIRNNHAGYTFDKVISKVKMEEIPPEEN